MVLYWEVSWIALQICTFCTCCTHYSFYKRDTRFSAIDSIFFWYFLCSGLFSLTSQSFQSGEKKKKPVCSSTPGPRPFAESSPLSLWPVSCLNVCLLVGTYLLCLTAATRSGPENMEKRLSPLTDDVSSLELAESPWLADQLLFTASLRMQPQEVLAVLSLLLSSKRFVILKEDHTQKKKKNIWKWLKSFTCLQDLFILIQSKELPEMSKWYPF